jgi:hypothetical protein
VRTPTDDLPGGGWPHAHFISRTPQTDYVRPLYSLDALAAHSDAEIRTEKDDFHMLGLNYVHETW